MGLLSKIQTEFKKQKYVTQTELEAPGGSSITLQRSDLGQDDVWRYRRIRGVNLGETRY